ncbi:MAG: hypothetical protein HY216_08775 [Candidatus Rokubacteria bacterium]|nr:hypothetical protein [Candidatus Rokubacteria bacterium]
MTAARALAVWTGPVLVAGVGAAVFRGDALAPALVVAVILAPLVALLRAPAPATERLHRAGTAVDLAVGLVLSVLLMWADLLVMADVARSLGARAWHGPLVAGAIVLLATLWPLGGRGAAITLWLGVLALVVPLAVVAWAAPPWRAWSDVALRPAFAFTEASPWVTDGRALAAPATLTFTEAHRVTATAPGVFRIIEDDAGRAAVRDWRLNPGDGLTLRPGDRLVIAAGTRLRFEAGKRVPGAAPSGVTWADPPSRRRSRVLAEAGTLAFTVVGAVLAPALAVGVAVVAALLGIYGAWIAPDLGLGAPPSVPLVRLPLSTAGGVQGALLVASLVAGLLALLVAAACALRDRIAAGVVAWPGGDASRARHTIAGAEPSRSNTVAGAEPSRSNTIDGEAPSRSIVAFVVWGGVLAVGIGAACWPVDAWRVLLAALSIAACVTAAELGGAGSAPSRPLALLVGLLLVVAGLALGTRLGAGPTLATTYPALIAAPLAWAAGRVAARRFR